MKTKLLLSFLLITAALLAASAPVVTDALMRIQTDPATGIVQAFWRKSTVIDGTTYTDAQLENHWALTSTATVSITLADGSTAITTRTAVFNAVVAIATQEHAAP